VLLELENDLVFVSIAAYRDPQLIATVEDCIRKSLSFLSITYLSCLKDQAIPVKVTCGDPHHSLP
jgi:hypothetical protein